MSQQQNDFSHVVAFLAILAGICFLGIKAFSQMVHLDMATSATVLLGMLVLPIGWWLVLKFTALDFYMTWPIALATLWGVWWPALDYWAVQGATSSLVDLYQLRPSPFEPEMAWYAEWYTKWGVVAGILGLGYTANAKLFARY